MSDVGGGEGEDEDDVDAQLRALLGGDATGDKKRGRFYCAGAKRTDESTGKKWCDYRAPRRWYGVCPGCFGPYDCLEESRNKNAATRVSLGQATMDAHKAMEYFSTGIPELDKVLGGGLVYAKTLLLGSPRGSGKTTAMLQACDGFAQEGRKSYFASGEMTRDAIIDYAARLGIVNDNVGLFGDPQGVDVENLFEDVLAFHAKFLVVDSVQVATVSDAKGDIGKPTMIDAAVNMVTSFAQAKKRAVVLIGHLNKDGNYGGTEAMQHLVDGLLRFDVKWSPGSDGKLVDSMVREICWDGKSRQGRSDLTALVELTDQGIRPPSVRAMRMLTRLHV